MRKIVVYAILILFLLPSCKGSRGSNIRVVKPKYHHRWYDRKKDKHTKRTKTLRVKN